MMTFDPDYYIGPKKCWTKKEENEWRRIMHEVRVRRGSKPILIVDDDLERAEQGVK
jgi:hypothetical protein